MMESSSSPPKKRKVETLTLNYVTNEVTGTASDLLMALEEGLASESKSTEDQELAVAVKEQEQQTPTKETERGLSPLNCEKMDTAAAPEGPKDEEMELAEPESELAQAVTASEQEQQTPTKETETEIYTDTYVKMDVAPAPEGCKDEERKSAEPELAVAIGEQEQQTPKKETETPNTTISSLGSMFTPVRSGLDAGLEVEEIVGYDHIETEDEQLGQDYGFWVKFKGKERLELIPREQCNAKCPIEVITYYERKITFTRYTRKKKGREE